MSTPAVSPQPALFATQGGGTAIYDSMTKKYLWYELPDWMVSMSEGDPDKAKVGDTVHKMWSFVPINDAARSLDYEPYSD